MEPYQRIAVAPLTHDRPWRERGAVDFDDQPPTIEDSRLGGGDDDGLVKSDAEERVEARRQERG